MVLPAGVTADGDGGDYSGRDWILRDASVWDTERST
jgi:hypothetical protein